MLGFDAIATLPLGDDAEGEAEPVSTYITASDRGDQPVRSS